jgi:hypothetical protein
MEKQLQLPSLQVERRSRAHNANQKKRKLQFTRGDVNRAGKIFRDISGSRNEVPWAAIVLGKWRAMHNYPINTFQATLRKRLQSIDKKLSLPNVSSAFHQSLKSFADFQTWNLRECKTSADCEPWLEH